MGKAGGGPDEDIGAAEQQDETAAELQVHYGGVAHSLTGSRREGSVQCRA